MSFLPKNIEQTIEEFSKLPGIGQKSAERLTFYLLRKKNEELDRFGSSVQQLKNGLNYCTNCQNMCTAELCGICQNPNRDSSVVCIVEEMLDLIALEKANEYKGHYHVLHGVISPMDGVGPDDLKILELVQHIQKGGVSEIIFALNPSIEGEATAAYILRQLPNTENLKITRIARGIPIGGDLEYADRHTLRKAFEERVGY